MKPSRFQFCKEIVEACGHRSMLFQYMAVVFGDKPLMDDWVSKDRLKDYIAACRLYGLHVRADVQFVVVDKEKVPAGVVGREKITSTSAYGLPLAAPFAGQVHVYVSREKNLLRHGMWYPVIIRGRLVPGSYADTLRYGQDLGYPECCIRFFRLKNDWNRYSFLFEVLKNTEAAPHFLCNPLLKDHGLSYIYHMPCSFRCAATLVQARRLRQRIARKEPQLAAEADRGLRGPFMVLYERQAFRFAGTLREGRLHYTEVAELAAAPAANPVFAHLKAGDAAEIRGREILVYNRGKLRRRLRVPLERFAPKFMFSLDFGR